MNNFDIPNLHRMLHLRQVHSCVTFMWFQIRDLSVVDVSRVCTSALDVLAPQ
jgi:hypothetical protein